MTDTNDQPTKPWARRPGETPQAYEAFLVYLNQPPGKRGLRTAFALANPGKDRINGSWPKWYRVNEWTQRAQAYDYNNNRIKVEAEEAARVEQAKKWAERRLATAEDEWEIGTQLLKRAKEMLMFAIAQQTRVTSTYEDGRPRETIVLEPVKWNGATVAKYAEAASLLRRRATDMVVDKIGLAPVPDQAKPEALDLMALAVEAYLRERVNTPALTREDLIATVATVYGVEPEALSAKLGNEEGALNG